MFVWCGGYAIVLKRVWSIAVVLAMLLSMLCVLGASAEDSVQNEAVQLNNAGPAYISLESSQVQVGLNGILTVNVFLNNYQSNLGSLGLEINYDPTLVTLANGEADIQASSFGSSDPQNPKSNIAFELAQGSIKAAWISETGENIAADAKTHLLTINFKTLEKEGTASISAGYMDGSMFTYDANGTIQEIVLGTDFAATIEPEEVQVVKAAVSLQLSADKQTIRQGQTVTLDVTLKDFYSQWALLSLVGSSDSDVFEISNVINAGAFPGEFIWEVGANSPLAVCWVNATDQPLKNANGEVITDAVIMQVELTAKTDVTLSSEPYPIQFSFVPEGNFCFSLDANNPIAADSGIYIPDSNELSVQVLPCPYLSISANKTVVAQGGEVQITVRLNEFYDKWSIMTIKADLDKSVFDVVEIQNLESFPGEFIAEEGSASLMAASWVNAEDVGTATPDADLMVVTLKAKQDLNLAENQIPVSFSFVPDGVVSMTLDPNAALTEEGGWYIAKSNDLTITIANKPSLEIAVDKTELKPGDEVTVDVTVKDLSIPWTMLSFVTNIDNNVFELAEVIDPELFPGELIYEPGTNTPLAVCWFNSEDLLLADPSAKVLSFKLRVKETVALAEDTIYPLSISFADEGNVSLTIDPDQALTESYYNKTSNEVEITVQAVEETVAIKIEWGNMLFNYDAGEWDTETHRWVGGGWTTATDFNKITVTNQGQVDVGVTFEYQSLIEGMSGAFSILNAEEYEPLAGALSLPKGAAEGEMPTKAVWLNLDGLPQDKDALGATAETVGTVTITINSLEEEPNE